MTGWYSVETAEAQDRLRDVWQEAPLDLLELAGMLLEVAREQVLAYAPEEYQPVPGVPYVVPLRFVYAQLKQAENLYNAGRVNGNGDVGPDGYSFQPRPLDKTIRSIIRPRSGTADVY